MHQPQPGGESVFKTPWFEIFSRRLPDAQHPHYTIHSVDFAVVVAVTAEGGLLMVRQFRPAVGARSLELPAGHVEIGETPEEAARKELLEETGYEADVFELTATLSPSTARFTNRMWCFYAANARPRKGAVVETGMEPVLYRKGLAALLQENDFYSAGSCSALFAAAVRGRIRI